jgi:hypothetical protein
MTQEELWRDIGTLQQMHFEFCELVKKMRDAQKRKNKLHIGLIFKKEINVPISEEDTFEFSSAVDEMYDVEEEVDKYLINYFKQ